MNDTNTQKHETQTQKKPAPAKQAGVIDLDNMPSAMEPSTLLLLLLSVVFGAGAAVIVLPVWMPSLNASLFGEHAKAFWYLARSSGFVAYGLLWLSMMLGLLITNKMARLWPGGPVAFDLHQHASLLALAATLFHALILMGDSYINYTMVQLLVPFASEGYRPLWVGLGQVAFYLLAIVSLSYYVRKMIGRKVWRLLHFLTFSLFVLALVHGVTSGTDSDTFWAQALYWGSGGSVLLLTIYRVLITVPSLAPPRPASSSR
jgi:predicted ferric reductase